MPNRARMGAVSKPIRVVAPTKCKWIQGNLYTSGIWSAIDHDIDAIIFHS